MVHHIQIKIRLIQIVQYCIQIITQCLLVIFINKTQNGSTTTSTIEIPNNYLNDTLVDQKDPNVQLIIM